MTGLWSCMTSRRRAAGLPGMTAGKSVKYFAMSFVTLNVVMAPRVIRSCLPTSTTFRIFAGSESRSTMFAASRAAEVPLFIAIPTSAFARAGASFVPSPSTPTTCPRFCSSSTRTSLSAGFAPAMTSSMPASWAITRAVSSASPVTMTVLMPVARTASSFSRMCGFRLSRRLMSPTTRRSTATAIGVPPVLEISWACQRSSASLTSGDRSRIASTAPLRTFAGRADTSRSRRSRQMRLSAASGGAVGNSWIPSVPGRGTNSSTPLTRFSALKSIDFPARSRGVSGRTHPFSFETSMIERPSGVWS